MNLRVFPAACFSSFHRLDRFVSGIDRTWEIRPERPEDAEAVEALVAKVFGPGRYAKSAYRLREGVEPDWNLSFVARIGTLVVGANRITPPPEFRSHLIDAILRSFERRNPLSLIHI